MGRDGPCTKRVSKERASIGKVTCGYHDTQEPNDEDDTDGEYEVIATPIAIPTQPNVALVSKANTVAALTQSIGRVARDKKRKTTVAVEPSQSKRMRWTDEEHQLFLEGIKQFGKGAEANRQISEKFVTTKTPSQVASHAQKYYLKANGPSAPLEDSAMNIGHMAVKSQLGINNIVWVKTGKTSHWPGLIKEIHNGHGQCKTREGLSSSEFNDGKERFVVWTYDNKTMEPKTARNLTYFCPGTHFEKYKKAGKSPGFIAAVKTACEQFNKSRREHDKSKNTTTAPEHLCTF
jgi:SHAQKYF class myb-like DNA-binding protein